MQKPNKIGPFIIYNKKPSTMKYGSYYYAQMELPFSKEKNRTIRVWLPEDYDFKNSKKRYPVIYMSDGQNLVDRHLSAYGEWKLDETVHEMQQAGFPGVIAVGIDCPKEPIERTKELCPPYVPRKEVFKREGGEFIPYANEYVDFIADVLKPIIDKHFFTKKGRIYTAIGGSSMGGIMAFYACMHRPEIFGFTLSFSPAFFFYEKNDWESIMDKYDLNQIKNGEIFLYVGGKEFEKVFVKPVRNTYEYLKKKGFDHRHLSLVVDKDAYHNEEAWSKHLFEALSSWLFHITRFII